MIEPGADYVMFIEPRNPASEVPVDDELTAHMEAALAQATTTDEFYLGHHECVCGARSGCQDLYLSNGKITNSLAVHYLRYHRDEVPDSELQKVRRINLTPAAVYEKAASDLGRSLRDITAECLGELRKAARRGEA